MTKNVKDVNMNPCKLCMPMGGALAIKGLEGSINIMHSSQGCSTYVRRHIAQHYNEPMDIASSALTEQATVYGGGDYLKKAIKNVMKVYKPKVIGVTTSCLAETIGEDIERVIAEFMVDEGIDHEELKIFYAGTPGYGGTQFEGYYYTIKRMIETWTKPAEKHNKINIISGLITPADIRHLKYILSLFDIEAIIVPDISETLDAPYKKGEFNKIPDGGTKIKDIEVMSGSIATIEMGVSVKPEHSAGEYLKQIYDVPLYKVPIPMGLTFTDMFLKTLSEITGKDIPEVIKKNRGRMIDAMIDSHKYNREGVATVFGEPELTLSVAKLLSENGLRPAIISTGAKLETFSNLIKEKITEYPNIPVIDDTDFDVVRKLSVKKGSNILVGHFEGKCITRLEGIPLIRIGFPIHDRIGAQRQLNCFYEGSMRFMDTITNTIIDKKYSSHKERHYEGYYLQKDLDMKVLD